MDTSYTLFYVLLSIFSILILLIFQKIQQWHRIQEAIVCNLKDELIEKFNKQSLVLQNILESSRQQTNDQQFKTLKVLQDTLREGLLDTRNQVEQSLAAGFVKTTTTFQDVMQRLALIDEAQKKITELSGNVVSLQEILIDKRSRGAFGEIQLKNLITNMLPAKNINWQATLSNGFRVDCLLIMPPPTGNLAIDSKFPLENYQKFTSFNKELATQNKYRQAFKVDIKKHIQDIANKYIINGETAEGAIMFIPAEAVFSEIHSNFPELVTYAQQKNIWLVSPTTMMAILTTANSVLKDYATREHVNTIQKHLRYLAEDFTRFDLRMNKLAKHISQVNDDVQQVKTSAEKITKRFKVIDSVELTKNTNNVAEANEIE